MAASICPSCGRPLPDGSRFCGACGAQIAPPAGGPAKEPSAAQGGAASATLFEFAPGASSGAAAPPGAAPVAPGPAARPESAGRLGLAKTALLQTPLAGAPGPAASPPAPAGPGPA